MSTVETEQVLVVPTAVFHELGHFQGFCGDVERYLDNLLDPLHTSYRPRGEMETDPSFKQLIPYVLFQHLDSKSGRQIFAYTRGKGQGEQRLHSKMSVGVGGHISSLDSQRENGETYREGMHRELAEEVFVDTPYEERIVGMINDDETEVGRVHLGVVHLCTVEKPAITSQEEDILEAGFRPVADLLQQLDRMESWSSICLQALFGASS